MKTGYRRIIRVDEARNKNMSVILASRKPNAIQADPLYERSHFAVKMTGLFLRYQYISATSDMMIRLRKLVGQKVDLKKSCKKMSKILILPSTFETVRCF